MSCEANKDQVRRHIDLSWNKAEFDRLDEVWSPNAVVHLWDGTSLAGLDALKQHLRGAVLSWTDRQCDIEQLAAEGDIVANRWIFRAALPSGERWTMKGMDFYRFAEGKIVEEWIALGNAAADERAP
jgi:predicted ester cyclase